MMDIEDYRARVGVVVGLAVAAATAYAMWGGGGPVLPAGRNSVLLLLVVVGPPVVAGVIAGLACAFLLGGPLYHAAKARNAARFRRALARGDVNSMREAQRIGGLSVTWPLDDATGNTPLHLAAINGQAAMVEALVEMSDGWPERNRERKTFLDAAPAEHAQAIRRAFCRAYGRVLAPALEWDLQELGPADATRDLFELWAERTVARFDGTTDFGSLGWVPDPKSAAEIFIDIGIAGADAGNLDVALAAENAAIRLDPGNPFAFLRRSITWSRKGDLERTLADATQAIRLDPTSALAYQMRGAAHDDLGNVAQAIADYGNALQLDPAAVTCEKRLNDLIASRLRR